MESGTMVSLGKDAYINVAGTMEEAIGAAFDIPFQGSALDPETSN